MFTKGEIRIFLERVEENKNGIVAFRARYVAVAAKS
jgi:hypothetical protein